MTKREQFIGYVRSGGVPICSPQIGAGAGFDTKLAEKEWISETTLEDTISAVGRFDIVPLINIGCAYAAALPLQWEVVSRQRQEDKVTTAFALRTPAGALTQRVVETKREGSFAPECAVKSEEDLRVLEYYIDALREADFPCVMKQTRDAVRRIAGRAALSVQWAVQPYELLGFPNTVDTVLLQNDCPGRCAAIMQKIVEIDRKLFKAVAAGGADFIFLGAPAAEMLSPCIYERLIIPYSQMVTEAAHDCGLLVYSHICSPIEPFLSMGFYNRMGIDLFETLSPPPVGNVASISDALGKLDDQICTRGNIGLDVLLHGAPDEIRAKTLGILKESAGRKHIVAASDYLFYHTPVQNVKVMADTVNACF